MIQRHLLIYLFLGLSMLVPSGTYAQQSSIIDLRHADRLEGKVILGEDVRELIGNVHFVQIPMSGGEVKVWCDRALRYMVQNKIELFGNVKVIRDSVTIRSKEGTYYGDQRMMEARENVELQRGKTTLTADHGKYFVEEKRSLFWDNVVLIDSTSKVTCSMMNYYEPDARSVATGNVHVYENENAINIYGDSLVHFEKQKMTLVLKNPRLIKIDTSANGIIDTLVVVSNIMQSFQDSLDRFVAIDNVRMVKSDMSARCGITTYFVQKDIIVLQTHPIIWSGGSQITGDSIRVFMQDKRLRSLWVKNHAMAISQADSSLPNRYNQLTGRELTMFFRDNKLEKVDVQKNATSLYYLFDKSAANGANKSSGDRIMIDFLVGEVDRIKVVKGVEGQFYPERMIFQREAEYNLDGFRLMTNRPIRDRVHIAND